MESSIEKEAADPVKCLGEYAETGCERAFSRVVEHYGGMVFESALRRTSDRQLAEEITQDVFSILARKAKGLTGHPSLAGWLFTTTRLRTNDALKTEIRKKQRSVPLREHDIDGAEGIPDALDGSLPMLDEALDKLRPADREVLLWHYFERMPYREVAARLGKSEPACRKQASRALEKLGAILKRRGYAVPVAAIATALSAQLARETSAAMAGSITSSALAGATTLTTKTLIINSVYTMAYGKTKTAIAVAALAALPVGMQWQEKRALERELAQLRESVIASARPTSQSPITETLPAANPGRSNQQVHSGAAARRKESGDEMSNWPGDRNTFVIPRSFLKHLEIPVINESKLSIGRKMQTILEITPAEKEKLEKGLAELRASIWAHEQSVVEVRETTDEKQSYYIPAFPEYGSGVRDQVDGLVRSVLGGERGDFFLHRFAELDDGDRLRTFGGFGNYNRLIEFQDNPELDAILVRVTRFTEDGSQRSQVAGNYTELPNEFRHLFKEDVKPVE